MVTPEEINVNFNFIGVRPTESIILKCIELCQMYKLTAEDIVNQWSAFAASELSSAAPTIDALKLMERRELIKLKLESHSAGIKFHSKRIESEATGTLSAHEGTKPQHSLSSELDYIKPEVSTTTSTPDKNKYVERPDSLTVLLSVGTCIDKKSVIPMMVKHWGPESKWLTSEINYMFELITTAAESINQITHNLGLSLMKKHNMVNFEGITKKSGNIFTFGKICCDADGKLNSASVQLENTWELGEGSRINLNLSKLSSFALFPGQVIGVQGNVISNSLVAENIFIDAAPPFAAEQLKIEGMMEILIAAGPFTLSDSILYRPLQDFIKYATQKKPHLIILVGPFLNEFHEKINNEDLLESYDSFFSNLVECVMAPFKDQPTQVVMVASSKDVFHHPVYPTPPYELRHQFPNLHFMPDPSMLTINGLVVGVTSTDILVHLSKEEINYGLSPIDRISRLVSHLFQQQSFYPLYPSNPEVPLNMKLLKKYGAMKIIPHLFILPSSIKYMVKEVKGCLVVNPEKLIKSGSAAGTFAHFRVSAPQGGSVISYSKCDIIRI